MSGGLAAPVAGGLAAGIGFVILFAIMQSGSSDVGPRGSSYVEVVIPEGASLESNAITYEPSIISVFVGLNNTVMWTNHDIVTHSIRSDGGLDAGFSRAGRDSLLGPGESFEYTFEQPGVYGYHGEPGPWLRGIVVVLPEIEKTPYINVVVLGLQDNYYTDEPVRFSVLVEGYETGCGTLSVVMIEKESGMTYSTGLHSDCPIDTPFNDFRLNLPVDYTSEEFSIAVDQPGTYELSVTYLANITEVTGMTALDIGVAERR